MRGDFGWIASAPRVSYEGTAFRHLAAEWDPLSGEGARINGGRFNAPDSFSVLYLCTRYEVILDRVLDLTSEATLELLGVTAAQVVGADLSLPRQIGEAAYASGDEAIRAPSATGTDDVLAVFPELIEADSLLPELLERWETTADLESEDD